MILYMQEGVFMSQKHMREKGTFHSPQIPKTLRSDILIIGGGPAGMAAAISAKRSNSKLDVVLIEKMKSWAVSFVQLVMEDAI